MLTSAKVLVSKYRDKLGLVDGYSVAYIFISMIISIGIVMLIYTLFNDYVTSIFYEIGTRNGGKQEIFDFIVQAWQVYFVIAFVVSMILWAIVNAMRQE